MYFVTIMHDAPNSLIFAINMILIQLFTILLNLKIKILKLNFINEQIHMQPHAYIRSICRERTHDISNLDKYSWRERCGYKEIDDLDFRASEVELMPLFYWSRYWSNLAFCSTINILIQTRRVMEAGMGHGPPNIWKGLLYPPTLKISFVPPYFWKKLFLPWSLYYKKCKKIP